jgi:hypothetical protein
MNNQAVQSVEFRPVAGLTPTQAVGAALQTVRVLLAHVRETIGGGSATDHEALGGMNAHLRRDIGADTSLGPHSSANRDLLYPRL